MTRTEHRKLKEIAPKFFRELSLIGLRSRERHTCPLGERGVECGPGWFNLIARTASAIEGLIVKLPKRARGRGACAIQVKEKYGRLTIYFHGTTSVIQKVLDRACARSLAICEDCGRAGKLGSRQRLLATLCNDHAKERRPWNAAERVELDEAQGTFGPFYR
jgi:hypothetical protein